MIINLAKIRFGGNTGGGAPAKPEDSFQETYTANGSYDITPETGHVFSGGHVEVNVQPRLQTKETTPLTLAQTVSPDAGYDGLQSVTVTGVTSEIDSNITADNIKKDVTILGVTGTLESGITPTGTINISANGTYDVTDKATAVVAVGGKDYRNMNGTPDVAGLTAIGWDADSIGYYGANSPSHYAWENDNYKLSQKNIDLYSLADPQPSLYKDDPEVTFVPNKNMSSYFGNSFAFNGMKYIEYIPLYDTSNVTSMSFMFNGCNSLISIPLLDTSKVTSMNYMFSSCSSLTSIPQLDTSSATNMDSMFYYCNSLISIPLLDTSKATNMKGMFDYCNSLISIPQLDTSSATNMDSMFFACFKLTSIPQLNTSKVTNMSKMIQDCSSLQSVDGIDFSSLTSNPDYFLGYNNLTKLTHFIVNGSINFSWNDNYGLYRAPNLDYESVKSILEAMNRTTNTDAKTMKLNCTIADQNGELAGLVSSCATKGWTVTGLTIN